MILNSQIDSHKVLEAMLEHAPTERGKRYVACAIICCREDVQELVSLANDRVRLLLWPCITRDTLPVGPYSRFIWSKRHIRTGLHRSLFIPTPPCNRLRPQSQIREVKNLQPRYGPYESGSYRR
jgi:hypothetical protein